LSKGTFNLKIAFARYGGDTLFVFANKGYSNIKGFIMSRQKLTQEQFIQRAEKRWINLYHLYDVSKFIYKEYRIKGIIICKLHGGWKITASHFLMGHGCP